MAPREPSTGDAPTRLPITALRPNPSQPRRVFHERSLDALVESLETHGMLEPIIVQAGPDGYTILAGERRWRAARRAGWSDVPVVVRDGSADDGAALELALVENALRDDLGPIELAMAVRTLIALRRYTHAEVGKTLGKSRATVSNLLRLLDLPEPIRKLVAIGRLGVDHALSLGVASDEARMIQLAEQAASENLSARAIRRLARPSKRTPQKKSPGTRDLELRLTRRFGTRSTVVDRNGKGKIIINYRSLDELDRILELVLG